MEGKDWKNFDDGVEKFGKGIERFEEMCKKVQEAVDSCDFSALNQSSITNTFNDTLEGFISGVRNVMQGENTFVQPGAPKPQVVVSHKEKKKKLPKRSAYFANLTWTRIAGILLTVSGIAIGGSFWVALLISLFLAFVGSGLLIAGTSAMVALGAFTLGFSGMAIAGVTMTRRAKRFRTYVEQLGDREYVEFQELSQELERPVPFLVKDVRRMIRKGWFKQGRLDRQKTCLMVSDDAYQQYQKLLLQMENKALIEEIQLAKDEQIDAVPEVQDIIKTGDAYIQKLRESNRAIRDNEVSAKIYRMAMLVERIFSRVRANPESVSDVRRLMDYYLPTTVKLLSAYEELDLQPIQGENIQASKKEIEGTLDTLNIAFEKILDGMFQSKAMDLSTDITVLQTMLAQEGLGKKDF